MHASMHHVPLIITIFVINNAFQIFFKDFTELMYT